MMGMADYYPMDMIMIADRIYVLLQMKNRLICIDSKYLSVI